MKEKLVPVIAIIALTALVLAIWAIVSMPKIAQYMPVSIPSPTEIAQQFGVAGGMLAEQYIPYVRYNGGYRSELSFRIGANGTDFTQIISGTCNQIPPNQAVGASSTLYMDCAVTGVASGDVVLATLPTNATSTINATSTSGGWKFIGATASSTAGYIQFAWQNKIGQATQIPNCNGSACPTSYISGTTGGIGLGSSTRYWVIR